MIFWWVGRDLPFFLIIVGVIVIRLIFFIFSAVAVWSCRTLVTLPFSIAEATLHKKIKRSAALFFFLPLCIWRTAQRETGTVV